MEQENILFDFIFLFFFPHEKAPVNAWQRTESHSAGETIDFGCFLSQRAPVMRLQWLDSVVPNSSRTAGFLTGSMAGPLVLPPLKHEGDRGRCGYYLSSSQIPSISPSAKMKRRRARQRRKRGEKNKSLHISFIWEGKCFCAVEIDASAPALPGISTHGSSNLFFLFIFFFFARWFSAVPPSAHTSTHLANVSLAPPPSLRALSAGSCAINSS